MNKIKPFVGKCSNFHDFFSWIQQFNLNNAIICQNVKHTYKTLLNDINQIRLILKKQNIQIGDYVALSFESNTYEYVKWALGVMSYGAIAVPICKYFNIVLPNYFLVYKFKILIYSQQTINFVNEMKNTLDTTCKCLESLKLIEELDDCKEFVLPFQEISPFGCLISLSSGTTGKPKQILLSQYTILHFLREDHILWTKVLKHFENTGKYSIGDSFFSFLPLCRSSVFIMQIIYPLMMGWTIYLESSKLLHDTYKLKQKIIEVNPNIIFCMSSLLMPMYNIFSSFKNKLFLLTCGGSIHDHNFIEKFKSINIDVCPAYAATEFNVLSILLPDDNIKFSISSGILVSNDVKIEIDNNGLILAKSESMMLGYIGDKGELMNPLNNGWFHTLDFAHFDNKFLYVIGRKSLSHYSTWKDKKNDSNN